MQKPIVFFSHSSRDQISLTRLKEMVVEKTGSSIEIFLSSDGQSIPLGRNWVHRIEEALKEAKLMLVFVSPNTLRSNWIFFESGFAYAKGIRVVPVGIFGVDLGKLSPPLSLLQGFNIASADGLDNIIALFNETFSYSHSGRFSKSEFTHLFSHEEEAVKSVFDEYSSLIDEIRVHLTREKDLNCNIDQARECTISVLQQEKVPYQQERNNVHAHGISLSYTSNAPANYIDLKLDPNLTAITIPLLDKIFSSIRDDGVIGLSFIFEFIPFVGCIQGRHKITARIYNTPISLGEEDRLIWEQVEFKVGSLRSPQPLRSLSQHSRLLPQRSSSSGNAYIDIRCRIAELSQVRLLPLLQLLFDRGILFLREDGDSLPWEDE